MFVFLTNVTSCNLFHMYASNIISVINMLSFFFKCFTVSISFSFFFPVFFEMNITTIPGDFYDNHWEIIRYRLHVYFCNWHKCLMNYILEMLPLVSTVSSS